MRRVTLLGSLFSITLLFAAGCSTQPPAPETDAVVYEGARLIVGDESAPIENAAIVVENGRFTAAGPSGQVTVPEGAARVDLTGKTVMPAIIDTHKHLAGTREALVDQLEHLAYYGVGVATSLGQDEGDLEGSPVTRQRPVGIQIERLVRLSEKERRCVLVKGCISGFAP